MTYLQEKLRDALHGAKGYYFLHVNNLDQHILTGSLNIH